MIAKRTLIGYLFFLTLFFSIFYISGVSAVKYSLISLFLYSLIAFVVHRVYTSIMKKQQKTFLEFMLIFFYSVSILTCGVIIIVGSFIVYQTRINPALLPQYTLKSEEKTLIFQGMSHVASETFYESVREDIRKAKLSDYVLFFEGVRPGSPENKEKFDEALGVSLTPESYDILANLYGVVSQDNGSFLGIENNKNYNIDLNIDEIIEIYEAKISQNLDGQEYTENEKENNTPVYDIDKKALSSLGSLNPKELFILRYFNQSIMNFMIKHESVREFILSLIEREDIFSVILDERNKHLAKEIISSQENKIFVIYGLMHFEGVYEILQESGGNWEIISTKFTRAIEPPLLP